MKRTMPRIGLALALILLAFWLYTIGKAHVFILDNKAITIEGTEWNSLAAVRVRVDRAEPLELYRRERDKVDVLGRRHTITVEVLDRNGKAVKVLKRRFRVRNGQHMYLISLPALTGEAEHWLQEFEPPGGS